MVAISDFSTFSQITYVSIKHIVSLLGQRRWENSHHGSNGLEKQRATTYGNAVSVFLADAFSFCLAFLEGMLVLKLGAHDGGVVSTTGDSLSGSSSWSLGR